jgi:U3 small nucleolar RNA-associated protein 23
MTTSVLQVATADGEAKRKRVRKQKRGKKDNKQLESAN